jgi:hypothetical protein
LFGIVSGLVGYALLSPRGNPLAKPVAEQPSRVGLNFRKRERKENPSCR